LRAVSPWLLAQEVSRWLSSQHPALAYATNALCIRK
jgi:hypothetical protein